MDLFLIDGISPFFKGYREHKRVNWSKIPFEHLEKDGKADTEKLQQITENFRTVCRRVSEMGYNAITLDDIAHALPREEYEPEVNEKISVYASFYRQWMSIAAEHNLKVFLTTDFMFATPRSQELVGNKLSENITWFRNHVRDTLQAYPEIGGIILRIGEVDGHDVIGDFRSRLMIRKPSQARKLLRALLPIFEEADALFIFRLWSVGAYPIGDLIWNRNTLRSVFGPFDSKSLVLSIKHGESDFFRHLPLNKQFLRSGHQKIVELQARREYEGCGAYPSFIGGDVEEIHRELQQVRGLIGMSVWCQTGGWTKFHHLAFLESSSVWNEINTWVCIKIFREGMSSREAVQTFASAYLDASKTDALLELLNGSDQAIKTLLYIDEVAQRKLFFRRVRLPSTLAVYWDRILILHPLRKLLKCLVDSGEAKVLQGENALKVVHSMRKLAEEHDLPQEGLAFMEDTFAILAEARKYYFLPFDENELTELHRLVDLYTERYDIRYSIRLELTPFQVSSKSLRIFLRAMLREERGYRAFDHVFTLRFLSLFFPVVRRLGRNAIPDFLYKQAMGLEAVFK